jgi:hypothetical protein
VGIRSRCYGLANLDYPCKGHLARDVAPVVLPVRHASRKGTPNGGQGRYTAGRVSRFQGRLETGPIHWRKCSSLALPYVARRRQGIVG